MAERRIFNDGVCRSIDHVTLSQDFIVDQPLPRLGGDEPAISWAASFGEKASAPGCHMVEVDGRGAGDDSIEVGREVHGCFDTLTSAQGAADVVGPSVLFVVETSCYLLPKGCNGM